MSQRSFHCLVHLESARGDELTVTSLRATESLDAGQEVRVEAVAVVPFDPAELLGQAASIELLLDEEGSQSRSFHGYVFDVGVKTIRDEQYEVELVVRGRLELLGLGRSCRIFQEQSVPDIVSTLLDEAGLSGLYTWNLTGSYPPRPYVVQYNESDLAFIKRLLADEGIGFASRSSDDADELELFDDSTLLPEIDGETTLLDRRSTSLDVNVVSDTSDVRRGASDATMFRDYDFKNPTTDLSTETEGEDSAGRQVYVHPGSFLDPAVGQVRADRALESLQQRRQRLRGESDCPRLEPGRKLTLLEHAHLGTDGEYLVVAVTHELELHSTGGVASTYRNRFLCQPADTPYRPRLPLERPHPGGVQNGFVTVPSGAEIHSNEYGCVKVRFPWDRSGVTDDRSSSWLRVGQYALGGSMTIPRGGFEVLVDFEMGDLDRPAVVGHLYNGEDQPPYELPANAARSSFQTATTEGGAGANELRFDDTAGSEEILLNASFDYITSVGNDASVTVTNNESYDVGANRSLGVTSNSTLEVGAHETLDVGANQSITVAGDLTSGTGASQSVSIGGNRKLVVGGDLTEDTGGSLTRDVGALQSITGIKGCARKVVGSCDTTVGAAWAEMAGGSRAVNIGSSFSETVGALKMVKAKTVEVNTATAYTMTAAAETVKAAGARTDAAKGAVAITAGGGMKVKASDIVFSAGSKLLFKGGAITLELKSSGSVKITAPTVKVTQAKVLSQAMHKSG